MKLTVIGCWSPYPKTGEACSGYLIEHEDTKILLDCGHSVFSHLGQYTDFNQLDAVFISHFHPDHYVDLYALRHAIRGAMYSGIRTQPLQVFMPGDPGDMFNYWSEVPEFTVTRVGEEIAVMVGDMELRFYQGVHSVQSFAVKVIAGGTTLFYTGDTSYNEKFEDVAAGIDVLLAETTMLENEIEYARTSGHMTTFDSGLLARKSSPGLLIGTHLWPEYPLEQIEKELKLHYQNDFVIASCGLKLTI